MDAIVTLRAIDALEREDAERQIPEWRQASIEALAVAKALWVQVTSGRQRSVGVLERAAGRRRARRGRGGFPKVYVQRPNAPTPITK